MSSHQIFHKSSVIQCTSAKTVWKYELIKTIRSESKQILQDFQVSSSTSFIFINVNQCLYFIEWFSRYWIKFFFYFVDMDWVFYKIIITWSLYLSVNFVYQLSTVIEFGWPVFKYIFISQHLHFWVKCISSRQ